MKLRDLVGEDIDIDIYDDYDERCGLALCGPVRLTECGRTEFGNVLDMECIFFYSDLYGRRAVVHCGTAEDADRLKTFLLAAAGYVSDADYKRWFRED